MAPKDIIDARCEHCDKLTSVIRAERAAKDHLSKTKTSSAMIAYHAAVRAVDAAIVERDKERTGE